jgi:hypothetical protein
MGNIIQECVRLNAKCQANCSTVVATAGWKRFSAAAAIFSGFCGHFDNAVVWMLQVHEDQQDKQDPDMTAACQSPLEML